MRNKNYVYDDLDRLIEVHYGDDQKIIYTYDEAGNRGTVTITSGVVDAGTQIGVPPPHEAQTAIVDDVEATAQLELAVYSGPMAGWRFPLMAPETPIGRSQQNKITLADEKASEHHAVIKRLGEGYQIIDLGSLNGTFVNNVSVSQPATLEVGDEIRIGDTTLKVQVEKGV